MVFPFHAVTQSAKETKSLGARLGAYVLSQRGDSVPNVVCLYGSLGSGKTTFTQGFAQGLGISKRILSPTFIIVRRYSIPNTHRYLYHYDLYRVQSSEDVLAVGFDEMLHEPGSIIVVEWPEVMGKLIPKHRIDIKFIALSNGRHKIQGQKI